MAKTWVDEGHHKAANQALETALDLLTMAEEIEREGLLSGKSTANVPEDMTAAQLARRGRGIARGKAAGDARKEALVGRWGSLAKAATALATTPQSLSGYLGGAYPCPERIALRVEKETGLPADTRTWPKGLVK